MMEDGEVDLLYVWNGRGTVTIKDNGAPFAFDGIRLPIRARSRPGWR